MAIKYELKTQVAESERTRSKYIGKDLLFCMIYSRGAQVCIREICYGITGACRKACM